VFVVVDGVFLVCVGRVCGAVRGGRCCGWVLSPESRVGNTEDGGE